MRKLEAESQQGQTILPPIKITEDESRRLSSLANSTMDLFPRVAQFLAREVERATIAQADDLRGVVRMGSKVSYRDDGSGASREIVLVYPHEANIELNRISILTPVGAALIGLSEGQRIEFETPDKRTRGLTVLAVSE
ncbi:nucleoside diphosphate kinase regulator [Bradyrhizobium daqingense]|uniref:Regulator of nucleoside diphosphate kinase n=1 Tax=Bradyrhizobium daqingense TaxID=993502 RepID=A0A562KV11_9BRAD|nr:MULTISPECIES: nucleoside diphosphate kinase regulator [Bradyrhizobium]MDQ8731263.1 nucleoside diphosphate kinase regulator [Bradyrhizobium sp. LHD-71]TWH99033.1 regulator of nucleoside diphosphate kinase [Bradyrhizobium daqingense]UFS90706.1 nucleoside diphosphate kinase regulator [Bradyrhizobium daqingense]